MSERLEAGKATTNIRRQIRIQKMNNGDLVLVREKLLYNRAMIKAADCYAQAANQAGQRLRAAIRAAYPDAREGERVMGSNIADGIHSEDISLLEVITPGADREELRARLEAVEEAIRSNHDE